MVEHAVSGCKVQDSIPRSTKEKQNIIYFELPLKGLKNMHMYILTKPAGASFSLLSLTSYSMC